MSVTTQFDKNSKGMNMFRIVQEENGVVFYSQVLYRCQVHTLMEKYDWLQRWFPRFVRMEMRHSYTPGLGDWQEVDPYREKE